MMDLGEIRIVMKVCDGCNWLRTVFNDGVCYWLTGCSATRQTVGLFVRVSIT
jgi:hypothetical protein